MLNHSGGAWWSLWAKAGAVGNARALSTASRPVRRQPHRPQIHRAAVLRCVCLQGPAQPASPLSPELVPEHLGVQVFAFVAKPEQLPE